MKFNQAFRGLALLALFAALWVLLIRWQGITAAAPAAAPSDLPPAGPFGVWVWRAFDPQFPTRLDRAREFGLRYVNFYVEWSRVQPNQPPTLNCGGLYCWSEVDAAVNAVTSRGLTPVVTIAGNPTWVSTVRDGWITTPTVGLPAMAAFMGAMAARYPAIRYYSFYGEPDGWNPNPANPGAAHVGWGGHGAAYADMLKAVHPAVKSANPQAQVVFGGIAYEDWGCSGFPNDQCFDMNFVGDVLAAGGGPYFDVMDYHYYDDPFFKDKYTPKNLMGKARTLIQNFPGLAGKPFLLTETGSQWGDTRPGKTATHDTASRALVQIYSHLLAAREYGITIELATWFLLEYAEQPFSDGTIYWGLLQENTDLPWPTELATYRTLVEELGRARYKSTAPGIGVEAYVFDLPTWRVTVAWATDDNPRVYSVQANRILKREMTGARVAIVDNGPGDLDPAGGVIQVSVTRDPIYLETFRVNLLPSLCNSCSVQAIVPSALSRLIDASLCARCR